MKNNKLVRIVAAAILLLVAMTIEHTQSCSVGQLLFLYLVPYLLIGYDVIGEALENLFKGKLFNEDFLMCIATLGALGIGFSQEQKRNFPRLYLSCSSSKLESCLRIMPKEEAVSLFLI